MCLLPLYMCDAGDFPNNNTIISDTSYIYIHTSCPALNAISRELYIFKSAERFTYICNKFNWLGADSENDVCVWGGGGLSVWSYIYWLVFMFDMEWLVRYFGCYNYGGLLISHVNRGRSVDNRKTGRETGWNKTCFASRLIHKSDRECDSINIDIDVIEN